MALNTFGGAPGDVTANAAGDVAGGVIMKAYTAPFGGQRVTELYDTTGAPLAGVVVSIESGDNEGRVAFQASDQYQILYLDAGYGMRWAVPAREAFSAASTALDRSTAALDASQEAQAIAAESGVKADLAKAEVDAKLGFDITKLSPQYVTQLRTDPRNVMQSFARDPLTGDYYASQSMGSIGGTTNLVVHHLSPDGRRMSTCTFEGGGHGSTTAIENDGQDIWLWFRWTFDSSGGNFTNRMVRAKYQPNATIKRDNPEVLEVPDFSGDLLVSFYIDQPADRIATRTPVGTTERFTLYKFSDYKAGRNTPLAQLGPFPMLDNHPYQGHCTLDGHLYVSRGHSYDVNPDTTDITRYDWTTGDSVVINTDQAGKSLGAHPQDDNENEGVCVWRGRNGTPSLLFGKSTGDVQYRQALIYAFSPPAGDNLSSEVLRRLTRKQGGEVTITPTAANKPTEADVKFDWQFDVPPNVQVTMISSAPGTTVTGVAVYGVTTKGMKVLVTRTNTTATTVIWRAEEI